MLICCIIILKIAHRLKVKKSKLFAYVTFAHIIYNIVNGIKGFNFMYLLKCVLFSIYSINYSVAHPLIMFMLSLYAYHVLKS